MTWTLKVKATRPNTDVDWYAYQSDDDVREKLTVSFSLSENELELIKTFVWDDEASRDEHIEDYFASGVTDDRDEYNTANNISLVKLQDEAT